MTVGKKLHTTLINAESVYTDLRSYALDTENKQSQQLYSQLAQQMESTVNTLKSQVNSLESQEPQYKVFENMQQGQAGQAQGSQFQSGTLQGNNAQGKMTESTSTQGTQSASKMGTTKNKNKDW